VRVPSGDHWEVAFSAVAIRIETASDVTPELEGALAMLLPQLNPNIPAPAADRLRELIAKESVTLLIARDEAAIVGTATVIVYKTPAWNKALVEDVVVDESARGRGAGEALVRACIDVARRSGARMVELQSASFREAANRLYPRLGFERRDTNFYRLTFPDE
jgi:GNAT superfamily N-acetyltransferase